MSREVRYNVGRMPDSSAQPAIDQELWTEKELQEAIRDSTTRVVVTGNARAARALRQRFNQWQHASGNTGWKTAGISSWDAWLANLWENAAIRGSEARALLNEAQEVEIWRSILEADESAALLVSAASLAMSAQSAWTEMQHYRVALNSLRNDSSLDALAFIRWAGEFEKRCRKDSLLSTGQLELAATGWVTSHGVNIPEELLLTGFDRLTPAQTELLKALRAGGCRVRQIELRHSDDSGTKRAIITARTEIEETEAAAHWIRETLLANPAQRIGIIVPSLATRRASIDAAFRRILAPSLFQADAPPTILPYEFSLGTQMDVIPEIRAALLLLRWMHGSLKPEEISWLLVHGEFGETRRGDGAKSTLERERRARLDRSFRDRKFQLGSSVSFQNFRQWLFHEDNDAESIQLRRTLQRIFIALESGMLKKTGSFSDWRGHIEKLLVAAEWRVLNPVASRDFQLFARWNVLLDKLSSLNAVAGAVKFKIALERLEQLASETLFSLESHNAPVQILGVSESAGLLFDAVWWMGAQANTWPAPGRVQPYLPWSVQREARMPYTNPEADYAFALQVTRRILSSGRTVVTSFAQEIADNEDGNAHRPDRESLVSPLLRELLPQTPIVNAEDFVPSYSTARNATSFCNMEQIHEEASTPLQSRTIRGGVAFLEHQAACPFRAFAELRLAGQTLADFEAGLSRRDQGIVIHRALQHLWNDLKSQSGMLERSGNELREKLRDCIASALRGFLRSASESWQQTLLQIEAERIENRLMQWLEQERIRPAFDVIAKEDAVQSELGGVEFDCRIDRIDRVSQGLVLIDYKTGEASRASCTGERPDEPQLPAYAVLHNDVASEPLAAVAFARLQPRKMDFEVVASVPSALEAHKQPLSQVRTRHKENPKAFSPEQMQEQQDLWRQTLTRLAEDFRAGIAVVDPKKGGETCRHCAQGLLCRVQESDSIANAFADEENDSPFGSSAEMEFER